MFFFTYDNWKCDSPYNYIDESEIEEITVCECDNCKKEFDSKLLKDDLCKECFELYENGEI